MFSGLESEVKSWSSDEAKEVFSKHLVEMDSRWESLVRTNASVMLMVVAASKDRVLARELCDGIMTLMGRMCDAWASVAGDVSVQMPEQQAVFEESREVDRLGQRMGQEADVFQGVILTQMMLPLMGRWSEIFAMLAKANMDVVVKMDKSDATFVAVGCSDEMRRLFGESRDWLSTVMAEDSSQFKAALEWVAKARPRFEHIAKVWGDGSAPHAMAAVVREMGFPDATR